MPDRQFLIPGGQFLNQTNRLQYRIPGGGVINEVNFSVFTDVVTFATNAPDATYNTGNFYSEILNAGSITLSSIYVDQSGYYSSFVPGYGILTSGPARQVVVPGGYCATLTNRSFVYAAVRTRSNLTVTSTITATDSMVSQIAMNNIALFNLTAPDMPAVKSIAANAVSNQFGMIYFGETLFGGENIAASNQDTIDMVTFQIVIISDWFGVI